MSGAEFQFTDNQWYNFLCGFHAGLKLKDLGAIPFDINTLLYPIGVGGYGQIGIGLPEVPVDRTVLSLAIPVFTHDVDIGYSGFSINLSFNSSRLRFDGVSAGDFGTIGPSTGTTDIRYTYSNGNFKAIGLREHDVVFNEPIILFYINVTLLDTVTVDNPIDLLLNNNSFTDVNYCTLLTWVEILEGQWYNYYITPLVNVSGKIISEETRPSMGGSTSQLGDKTETGVAASPSGIFIGHAFTAPGNTGVVPIYANSNLEDNFPFYGAHINLTVHNELNYFSYIKAVGTMGFELTVVQTIVEDGINFDITAIRSNRDSDSTTFCYIEYQIAPTTPNNYSILLKNNSSELIG